MSEYTWYDSDNNGTYDTGLADLDGNGAVDTAAFDLSGNRVVDTYLTDGNGDGVLGDVVYSDATEDGSTDAMGFDVDQNWVLDARADASTGWQAVSTAPPQPWSDTVETSIPIGTASTPQMTLAGVYENTTDPIDRVMIANAIGIMNVSAAYNPWLD